jgi:SAM-dependent methyltransferase
VASFYGDDLAHIQHDGFRDFSARAAPALLKLLHGAGLRRGTVVDLGCGDGTWLRALTRAGHAAIGIEVSPALVKHARRQAPRARIHVGSIYTTPLPACDAVTALGEVLGYLPAAGERSARIPGFAAFFRRVARALRPGGLFAFDLVVRSAKRPLHTRNYREGEGWAVLAESIEDAKRGRLTRDITMFRRIGASDRWRRSHEVHRVRVPEKTEILRALRDAGFVAKASNAYGRNAAMLPGRAAFFARKPKRG